MASSKRVTISGPSKPPGSKRTGRSKYPDKTSSSLEPSRDRTQDQIVMFSEDYETYLRSHLTSEDLFYLESEHVALELLDLWANCDAIPLENKRNLLSRETFWHLKEQLMHESTGIVTKRLKSTIAVDIVHYQETKYYELLRERVLANKSQKLRSLIFLRMTYRKREISAYVDLSSRLVIQKPKTSIEDGTEAILPMASDLSYVDHSRPIKPMSADHRMHDSHHFIAMFTGAGMKFRSKETGECIVVDPRFKPGPSTTRTEVSHDCWPYTQAVFFDHSLHGTPSHHLLVSRLSMMRPVSMVGWVDMEHSTSRSRGDVAPSYSNLSGNDQPISEVPALCRRASC